jgi:hypothetical protein
MAAKFFISKCILPTFLQKSEDDAKSCGLVNGLIYCSLVTLIILAGGGRFYLNEENLEKKKQILYFIIGILCLIWLVIPLVSRNGEGKMWIGYQDAIKDLMNQGYSKKDALAFIQGIATSAEPNIGLAQGISAMVFAKGSQGGEDEKKNDEQKGENESDWKNKSENDDDRLR